jgi:uncharacterized surface protein with fasciclin (FAS1) repeats
MKANLSLKTLFCYLPVLLLLFLNGCKNDDLEVVKVNENVRAGADFIKNNYQLTLFSAAIEKAGMSDQLNGAGPFTFLAPSDAAFNAIGILRASDFDKMNRDSLKALVQRHVLSRRVLLQDIPVNGVDVRYSTLAGTQVYTSLASYYKGDVTQTINALYYNGAYVDRKDVQLTNGSLQLLNKVMKYNSGTIQDWLKKNAQYSIFIAGLKKFGLWDKLATTGPYTVFAPTNTAFESAGLTAAAVEALVPADYDGNRLFGGYILNNKHFFISDVVVFSAFSGETSYLKELENDVWCTQLSVTQGNDKSLSYSVRLKKARTGFSYTSKTGGNKSMASTDYLMDNGIVHSSDGIIALPSETRKQ